MGAALRSDVSVVIPTFNRANSIVTAVNSVLAQGPRVREVIVVDDCSEDETRQLVTALAEVDDRVRLLTADRNRGGGHARNLGIDAARAPLLAFLDSDDLWLEGKLEAQLDAIDAADAALEHGYLCFTNLEVDRGDGAPPTPWNRLRIEDTTSVASYLLEHGQAVQTSTWLLPTSLAAGIRFDDSLRRHQDYDFVLRAAAQGCRFVYVDRVLVRYSADPKAVRVSRRVNSRPSLDWLGKARAYLTPAQIARFYLTSVAELHFQDAPIGAVGRSIRYGLDGHASSVDVMRSLARAIVPATWRAWVRQRLTGKGAP